MKHIEINKEKVEVSNLFSYIIIVDLKQNDYENKIKYLS